MAAAPREGRPPPRLFSRLGAHQGEPCGGPRESGVSCRRASTRPIAAARRRPEVKSGTAPGDVPNVFGVADGVGAELRRTSVFEVASAMPAHDGPRGGGSIAGLPARRAGSQNRAVLVVGR